MMVTTMSSSISEKPRRDCLRLLGAQEISLARSLADGHVSAGINDSFILKPNRPIELFMWRQPDLVLFIIDKSYRPEFARDRISPMVEKSRSFT